MLEIEISSKPSHSSTRVESKKLTRLGTTSSFFRTLLQVGLCLWCAGKSDPKSWTQWEGKNNDVLRCTDITLESQMVVFTQTNTWWQMAVGEHVLERYTIANQQKESYASEERLLFRGICQLPLWQHQNGSPPSPIHSPTYLPGNLPYQIRAVLKKHVLYLSI